MTDEFPSGNSSWNQPLSSLGRHGPQQEEVNPPLHIGAQRTGEVPPEPPPVIRSASRPHPLDRTDDDLRSDAGEATRIRMAWVKLIWLLAFLAVLLAIAYLVPMIAEQTEYAITRGKQRAEHDFAQEHLSGTPLGELSRAYQMVSQVVGPSVVHINTQGVEGNLLPLTYRRGRIPSEGQGSGVIVEASGNTGYILTNNHVIREATQIQVSLADGRKVTAQVIGTDKATDLAVLKITGERLVPAAWGDSEAMEPGALVWAVGSPFGLERTITSGILSAKHRAGLAGTLHQDFLQSDAAVNPGNSGGPLVDSSGRVIGINTAIVGDAYQGISFAIPSNVARDIYTQIKSERMVRRGWLGVQLDEVTPELARQAGLAAPAGVYIADLVEQPDGSPAAQAGIQPGDVILRWNGTAVNARADLIPLVAKTAIGSRAQVVVFRNRQELTLDVKVGERPPLDY